ncbi:universal stress protein [Marinomonas ostreistagni]|uniref:Universal stress protein n=1 Tax=Marinomonas ostreistagni TaxID=359209 RepID=A0ABS0Z7I7_9GAMM|nr:universal stress protein [Marinomonas ostreistagni]MBJ7549616.1 universal stress protein [Marinomonas ostreistagni]
MTATYVVGVDGSDASHRALAFAKRQASLVGDGCALLLVCVVEWSPYKFQTHEENARRNKQKQEEIKIATERVIEPLLKELAAEGLTAEGKVVHGKAATALNNAAVEANAEQIFVARSADHGLSARVFGSVTAQLVMSANVPVTVVS